MNVNSDSPIDEHPRGWKLATLGDITVDSRRTLDPRDYPMEVFDYYSIPAYQNGQRPIPEVGSQIRSLKLVVQPGTVLFGKLNPRVPKVWLVKDGGDRRRVASTEFIPLVPTDQVDHQFLYYLARSEWVLPKSQELVSGSTPSRQRVDVSAFLRLEVPVPPIPQQRAIAHALRRVDRAKEATEQAIAAARELKRSLMRHLFSYGVDGASATKEVEFGQVPSNWEMVPLGELSTVIRGSSPRPKGNPRYFATDVTDFPWIMISDLRRYQRGKVLTRTNEYLTAEGKEKGRFVQAGTLLLTNSGTVGKPAILGFDGCIHDGYLAFLDLDLSLRKHYLYYLFQYLEGHLLSLAPRGTQANLNTRILKTLQIPVPPLATQDRIDRALTAVDWKIEAEEARGDAFATLFDSLLHDLMSAQLRATDLEVAS